MDLVVGRALSIGELGVEFVVVDVVVEEMASIVVVDSMVAVVGELPNLEVVNDALDGAVASNLAEDEEEEEHSNPC